MTDPEMIAATLTSAILQTRTARLVAQAQLLSKPGQPPLTGMLVGDPHEIDNVVQLFRDVLAKL